MSKPWQISQQVPELLHFKEYTKLAGAAQTDHVEGFAINISPLSQFGISVAQWKHGKWQTAGSECTLLILTYFVIVCMEGGCRLMRQRKLKNKSLILTKMNSHKGGIYKPDFLK